MSELKAEQIKEWKAKYGRLAKVQIGGVDYVYRPINVKEYYEVQNLGSVEENTEAGGQEAVIRKAVLTPELPELLPAGIVLKLSDEILKLSGFTEELKPEEL